MAADNGGFPNWETWINQMSEDQREYEKYRVMYALLCRQSETERRIQALEEARKPRMIRDLSIQAGSGFLGGLVGVYSFLRLFNPFQ